MHHMTPLRKALNYVLPQVTQLRVQATGRAPLIKMLNILSSQLGGRTLPEVLGLQVNFLLRYAEPLAQCGENSGGMAAMPRGKLSNMHTFLPHFYS